MSGPFPSTTVLNSPPCNLPGPAPGSSSALCVVNSTQSSADACAAACLAAAPCTSYTWHDSTQGAYAEACVFRTDGAWEPLTGAAGHTAGQKVEPPTLPVWPVQDGFARLPVMWFGANTSGLDNPDTLALLARHRVAGYGWQQGTGTLSPAGNVGRGEVHLAAAATHLADYLAANNSSSNPLVFVYRQIQVALRLFATGVEASADPANADVWIKNPTTGENCVAGQPWGTSDLLWNFSEPGAIDAWVGSTVAEVASESVIGVQAVFFDECDEGFCGYWSSPQAGCPAIPLASLAAMQADNNRMLQATATLLNANGVIPLFSLDNRLAASGANLSVALPCALPEDDTVAALANTSWSRFYENWPSSFWVADSPDLRSSMLANAILEGQMGIPLLLHVAAGSCPEAPRNITRPGRLGGDLEYAVATFLIVQTPQNVLSVSNNWYDADFCWHAEWDVLYGSPLQNATRVTPYVWTRNFTLCNVAVDLQAGTAEVELL
jgi:hypothetical protein